MGFHEVRFPVAVSRGAIGGPERRTQVVTPTGPQSTDIFRPGSRSITFAGYPLSNPPMAYRPPTQGSMPIG